MKEITSAEYAEMKRQEQEAKAAHRQEIRDREEEETRNGFGWYI